MSPATLDGPSDAAIAATRAVVSAAPAPMAVFDAAGKCLIANRAFALRAAHGGDTTHGETRTRFSPDGVCDWTLVTAPSDVEMPNSRQIAASAFFDTLANALPVMFNATDSDSRYLFMNRYQAAVYGCSPESAIGRTASELLNQPCGAYTRDRDLQVLRTGQPSGFYEESYATADGVERTWLTNKVPLIGAGGTTWGVVTVAIDINERIALEESLRRATAQAEAANRTKSGFLTAMSHELRTPLNAVIGFAEIIHQQVMGPLGAPEYMDYAGYILRSGRELLTLINDILDFARVESGMLKLVTAPIDLVKLVQSLLETHREAAAEGRVTLVAEPPPHPLPMSGDAARLRQALGNIIGNAVKFTQAGGHVVVAARRASDTTLVITVSDSGIGIDKEQIAHVFEPFWQADSGLARMHHGTGIGLPLARQLITLHGGTVDLESRLGEGTWVTVTLPDGM